jgi:hypothetical protein
MAIYIINDGYMIGDKVGGDTVTDAELIGQSVPFLLANYFMVPTDSPAPVEAPPTDPTKAEA